MTRTAADDDAFKTDLVALIPQMRAFARSLCGDFAMAEDLAQDALSKAWASRDSFTPGTNMKAWTFMILRNQFYSHKRRSWRSTPLDPEVAERTLTAVDNPTAALELDELRRAMAMLPEEQREALILIGAGGLSYEEASEICGAAVGTIKSRVSRARDRLALIYADGLITADGASPSEAMGSIFADIAALRSVA
ncbi:MAG TPA: sigma-70 family RNA polymerase sigma factor [Caulobacteraceae bacterium]|nr:sigma-70 family RNA polymerase sigma factor [Caulobacteraceae bacterium]